MTDLRTAKRPVTALAGPYGHPFHPILVTVPIGCWVAAFAFDVCSHVVDDPGFLTQGAEWLIAFGVLGALAAAMLGALDLRAIPTGTPAFKVALTHAAINVLVVGAYIVNFLWRHGSYTDGHAVAGGPMTLAAASLLALGASGWLGGKLAYRYGVRVVDEADQADGFRAGSVAPSRGHRPQPTT